MGALLGCTVVLDGVARAARQYGVFSRRGAFFGDQRVPDVVACNSIAIAIVVDDVAAFFGL